MKPQLQPDLVHAFEPTHPLIDAIDTRQAEDLERLKTCTEFARALSAFEWQGFGHRAMGRLVAVVSIPPPTKALCLEIYRRPRNFRSLSEAKKVAASRRMGLVTVRFFGGDYTGLADEIARRAFQGSETRIHR